MLAKQSSIGGTAIRQHEGVYFNPDEAARTLMVTNPALTQVDANSAAGHEGIRLLKQAIAKRLAFAIETILDGNTISRLLAQAAASGFEVHVWYAGLSSQELRITRV